MKIIIIILILLTQSLNAEWKKVSPFTQYVTNLTLYDDTLFFTVNSRIYKTTDKGESFALINPYNTKYLGGIGDILLYDDKIYASNSSGLNYSTDGGLTWLLDTVHGAIPSVTNIVRNADDIIIGAGGRIFLSPDNGNNWEMLTPGNWLVGTTLAVDGENIYVCGASKTEIPTFAFSHDYGKTWQRIEDTLSGLKGSGGVIGAWDNYVYVKTDSGFYVSNNKGISFDIIDNPDFKYIRRMEFVDDTLYLGTSKGLYISTDKGYAWQKTEIDFDVLDFLINKNEIYLGTEFGLAVSTDYGNNWEYKQKGLGSGSFFVLASNNSDIFTSAYNGVHISKDGGDIWKNNETLNVGNAQIIAAIDSSIFVTNNTHPKEKYRRLHISNDNGNTWFVVSDSSAYENPKVVNSISTDNNKGNVFVGDAENGLFISQDYGKSWNNLIDSLNVVSILIDEDVIYIGTIPSAIYASEDYGKNWRKILSIADGLSIYDDMIFLKMCGGKLIAIASELKYVKGMYFSDDIGKNWQIFKGEELPFGTIYDMIVYENNIFVITKFGILYSTDCGVSWNKHQGDWVNSFFTRKLMVYDDFLYAIVASEGIFKTPVSDFISIGVNDYSIERDYLYAYPPYPLPAIDIVSAKIYWDTKTDIQDDEITVYDIFGKKVAGKESITIDKLTNYSGILNWDCSAVQSGIYLIHIKHGSKSWTLKTIVNK